MENKKTGFFGHIMDMGDRKPEGIDETLAKEKDKPGFGGTITDMGQKDAVGVGEGK
jgi:hypothetical protein